VFVVLVIQFPAVTPALIILSAAPLSLVCVFAMRVVTGTALNVSSSKPGICLRLSIVAGLIQSSAAPPVPMKMADQGVWT
jgi:multidrug efflux pump subunit AcrB